MIEVDKDEYEQIVNKLNEYEELEFIETQTLTRIMNEMKRDCDLSLYPQDKVKTVWNILNELAERLNIVLYPAGNFGYSKELSD